MKKTLKLISVAVLAIISVIAMLAFAACKDDNGGTGDNGAEAGYFVIYAQLEDGTKVGSIDGTPIMAQWCVLNEDGTLGACLTPVNFDENGKAKISINMLKKSGDKFECHILDLPEGYTYDEHGYVVSESTTTVVTITIKHA